MVEMSAKELGNTPAYPVIGAPGAKEDYPGLTKREAFAMAAAQGFCANQEWMRNAHVVSGLDVIECIAHGSFEVADAMLTECAKEQP
jgi:hypothetical protein